MYLVPYTVSSVCINYIKPNQWIKNYRHKKYIKLCSYDIVNLYTNTPKTEHLHIIAVALGV
jgi:hypothetical protein